MPKIKKKTVIIFILLLIILYVVIAVIPKLTGALTRTEVVEYGDIRIEDEATCYIVRDETVYTAGASGTPKYFIEESTQIKKGTLVLELAVSEQKEGETEEDGRYDEILKRLGSSVVVDDDHVSKRKGVLTYYVDGYEKYFSVANVGKLNFDKTSALEISPLNVKGDTVAKGSPVFKICDNSKWYIVFWAEQEDTAQYQVGKQVTVVLPKGEIPGTIVDITEDEKKWQVTVETNRYYEGFTTERIVEGAIRTVDSSGLIINNGCLTTKDDQVGAYVKKTTGDFVFVPVHVFLSDGEKSLIAENIYFDEEGAPVNTIRVYDEVLRNPKVENSGKAKETDKESKKEKTTKAQKKGKEKEQE